MIRYVLLDAVVMALLALTAVIGRLSLKSLMNRRGVMTVGALLLLTAAGDNAILGLGLVDYDVRHILGVYLGYAPVEDFSYALTAAVLVPLLWERGANQ